MSLPRYAVDASSLRARFGTGIARYVACICRELEGLGQDRTSPFAITRLNGVAPAFHERPLASMAHHWTSISPPWCTRYEALLCTGENIPHVRTRARVAVIYDLYAISGINFRNSLSRMHFMQVYRLFADGADDIICISHSTRQEFLRHFDYPRDRLHVTHLGAEERFVPATTEAISEMRQRLGILRDYVFFVGLHHENKNLSRLLDALAISRPMAELDIVLAGPKASATSYLGRKIVDLGLTDRVRFTGYVKDEDLPTLYSGAVAFLFPSLQEGFGIPILEAMRCGTPVLTSTATSCPEVANGHAVLVDPYEVSSIAAGLESVLNRRPEQTDAARQYAEGMTWRRTAVQTLRILQRVATR